MDQDLSGLPSIGPRTLSYKWWAMHSCGVRHCNSHMDAGPSGVRPTPSNKLGGPAMDAATWKLAIGILVVLVVLVGAIYLDHEVLAFLSKLLG